MVLDAVWGNEDALGEVARGASAGLGCGARGGARRADAGMWAVAWVGRHKEDPWEVAWGRICRAVAGMWEVAR